MSLLAVCEILHCASLIQDDKTGNKVKVCFHYERSVGSHGILYVSYGKAAEKENGECVVSSVVFVFE